MRKTKPTTRNLGLLALALLIGGATSGCRTVVESYGAANVFGYATSGIYDAKETYFVNLMRCTTTLEPIKVDEVPGTAGSFFNTVSAAFPPAAGWSYATAANKLSAGSIEIKTYDAQGTPTRVGAEIHVIYDPGGSDPTTNIHWVQVLSTNHSLKPPAGHGNSATYVDIPGAATTPYYDDGYAADSGNCAAGCDFYDFPGRVDAAAEHDWVATTFLAQGPAVGAGAGAITFLRPGFQWGWVNDCEALIPFPWWVVYLERPITFQILDPLEPGARVRLEGKAAESLMLMKGDRQELETSLELRSLQLTLELDEQIDGGGYYPFRVSGGEISIGSYQLADDAVEGSTGKVTDGNGYLHWETGEASIQIETRLDLPGRPATPVIFTGTAAVDREARTLTLQADTKGIEQAQDKAGS